MTEDDRNGKLAYLARASSEELEGWKWARHIDGRPLFDGEAEAIARRELELLKRNPRP